MIIKKKKKLSFFSIKFPTSITILLLITALIILISWIPGTTDNWLKDESKPISIYNPLQKGGPLGIMDLFLAPINGFIDNSNIIIFVLIIGGYIGIIMKSGALDAGINILIKRLNGKEIWIIPSIMTILSIGGTVEGMSEETIPYYIIIIPAMLAAGFDVITGLLTILLGAGIGVMFSTINPFAIATASQASNINLIDGIIWRLICWFLATIGTIFFVMHYAINIKKNPKKSIVYNLHKEHYEYFIKKKEILEFNKKRKIILIIFGLTFLIMVFCITPWGKIAKTTIFDDFNNIIIKYFPYFTSKINSFGNWNIEMLSLLFLFASIIIAIIDWRGEKEYIRIFINGASELLNVALIIAVAGGISWSLQTSGIQHVFINQLKNINKLSRFSIVIISYFIFIFISFFIPSTSGFAKAIFPIISKIVIPLGLGSGMITTFVFASGWINLFGPSAGVMMSGLIISKVPLISFYKIIWPYIIGITIFSILMLSIGALLPQYIF